MKREGKKEDAETEKHLQEKGACKCKSEEEQSILKLSTAFSYFTFSDSTARFLYYIHNPCDECFIHS